MQKNFIKINWTWFRWHVNSKKSCFPLFTHFKFQFLRFCIIESFLTALFPFFVLWHIIKQLDKTEYVCRIFEEKSQFKNSDAFVPLLRCYHVIKRTFWGKFLWLCSRFFLKNSHFLFVYSCVTQKSCIVYFDLRERQFCMIRVPMENLSFSGQLTGEVQLQFRS